MTAMHSMGRLGGTPLEEGGRAALWPYRMMLWLELKRSLCQLGSTCHHLRAAVVRPSP